MADGPAGRGRGYAAIIFADAVVEGRSRIENEGQALASLSQVVGFFYGLVYFIGQMATQVSRSRPYESSGAAKETLAPRRVLTVVGSVEGRAI